MNVGVCQTLNVFLIYFIDKTKNISIMKEENPLFLLCINIRGHLAHPRSTYV